MKGHLTTLLGSTGALALLAGQAAAHPGHSASDVTAQLAAPLAGPDHVLVFAVASVVAVLGAARVALYVVECRRRAAATIRRNTRR